MSELLTYPSPRLFLDRIAEACLSREAELGLMIGIAADAPVAFACTFEEGDALTAAVLRTPGRGLVLASWVTGAASGLALAMKDAGVELDAPSVIGSATAAAEFATAWTEAPERLMAQHIYELREVAVPAGRTAPGELRRATEADLETVARWFAAFADEAMNEARDDENATRVANEHIAAGTLYVWDVGGPVSMAALTRPTFAGIAITAVYSPHEQRRRGYATACVAATSQVALDAGRSFCCLYTDAAHPTSNVIYQRVGYRFVAESALWDISGSR